MKKTRYLDDIFTFRESEKGFKENSMKFLYTMSLFTSLERFGNELDYIFMFKEFERRCEKKTP